MAIPKQHDHPQAEQMAPTPAPAASTRRFGQAEMLRAIFEDLRQYAPPEGEDDGWDELVEALDAERPEGMKLFPR